MKDIGLYIHAPFCASKCPYCDFYSIKPSEELMDAYLLKIQDEIKRWADKLQKNANTLYFGGGTPSLLGGNRIAKIVETARENFNLKNAEITLECNPSNDFETLLPIVSNAGVNRLSIGLQSAINEERKLLGRRAGREEVERTIHIAEEEGIKNISLDLMLGIPRQEMDSLKKSIDFCVTSGAKHISVYMLKIEEGTRFYDIHKTLNLPDEDMCCDMYLETCERLENGGFSQYEISNFAQNGYESKHNLKYWNDEEYLGLGPSAHSFLNGRRFFYDRDLNGYMRNTEKKDDGNGGDFYEYAMLRLRLNDGLREEQLKEKFAHGIPEKVMQRAKEMESNGLVIADREGIRLTRQGFLLSNRVISELLRD